MKISEEMGRSAVGANLVFALDSITMIFTNPNEGEHKVRPYGFRIWRLAC